MSTPENTVDDYADDEYVDNSYPKNPPRALNAGYELTERLRFVDLTNNLLTDLSGLELCTRIEVLVLRQNEIKNADPVASSAATLRSIDLYNNHLSEFHVHTYFPDLTTLDLSFNQFREIPAGLADASRLPSLTDLYFVSNKILEINGLDTLTSLRMVELGANRIRKIENLNSLVGLQELWLGKNKITSLLGLESLVNLKRLSVQSNRIVKIEGLETLTSLTELYLSHNGIEAIECTSTLKRLKILDLSHNRITRVENLSELNELEDLWLNANQLAEWEDLSELHNATKLDTLYLEGNPLATAPNYRQRVANIFTQLKQLDATLVARSRLLEN